MIVLLVAAAGGTAPHAHAAFPGRNGRIAVERCIQGCDIVTMTPKGNRVRNLTQTRWNYERDPAWSPNGKKIVYLCFTSDEDDGYSPSEICSSRANGSGRTRLTQTPGSESAPSWGPGGRVILFSYDGDIWKMRSDGTRRRPLTRTADVVETGPEWASDGSRIAYDYNAYLPAGGRCDCAAFTMKPDGSDRRRLIPDRNNVDSPHWSPRAKRILIHINENLFTVNRNGTGLRRVTRRGDVLSAEWSPNGEWIVFTRYAVAPEGHLLGTNIFKVRARGGDLALVKGHGDHRWFYAVSWQPRP